MVLLLFIRRLYMYVAIINNCTSLAFTWCGGLIFVVCGVCGVWVFKKFKVLKKLASSLRFGRDDFFFQATKRLCQLRPSSGVVCFFFKCKNRYY